MGNLGSVAIDRTVASKQGQTTLVAYTKYKIVRF